jgi:hypothetical protein
MALYEIVLRYPDRDEVRVTDRPLPEGEVVEIDGTSWHVVLDREPADIRATARYLCRLSEAQRERARGMRAGECARRVRLAGLEARIEGGSRNGSGSSAPVTRSDPEREVRAAQNQALFRALNERLDELNRASPSAVDTFTVACECGDMGCIEMIEIDQRDFLKIRQEPRQFAVLPAHVLPDVEVVVRDSDHYVVVEKTGMPG